MRLASCWYPVKNWWGCPVCDLLTGAQPGHIPCLICDNMRSEIWWFTMTTWTMIQSSCICLARVPSSSVIWGTSSLNLSLFCKIELVVATLPYKRKYENTFSRCPECQEVQWVFSPSCVSLENVIRFVNVMPLLFPREDPTGKWNKKGFIRNAAEKNVCPQDRYLETSHQ